MEDKGIGQDNITLGKMITDAGSHKTLWQIDRWMSEEEFKNSNPYDTSYIEGNLFVNGGLNLLWTLGCGGAGTAYSNANSAIAVGTSSTVATAADTALGAEAARAGMNASYPTYGVSQQVVWQSTFTALVANVSWQEFGVFNNATSGGTMLNHKISNQGTKTSGQVWQVNCTITIS